MSQIQVDLNKCETEYCGCGCPYFIPRFVVKRLSAILYALPKDEAINVQLLICENCGKLSRMSKAQYPGLVLPEVRIKPTEFDKNVAGQSIDNPNMTIEKKD